jgi:hypothetical protein
MSVCVSDYYMSVGQPDLLNYYIEGLAMESTELCGGSVPITEATTIPHNPAHATHAIVTMTPSYTPDPIFVSVTTVTSLTTTTVYTPLSETWSGGTVSLLADYCKTPAFSLCQGSTTAYWAAVVGCADERPECCPYGAVNYVSPGATEIIYTSAVTATNGPDSQPFIPTITIESTLPTAAPRLTQCPGDYHSISGGCCPS